MTAPGPEKFKDWPISTTHDMFFTHETEKPKFMQPKINKGKLVATDYLVSPRHFIRNH